MRSIIVFLCLLLAGVEAALDQRYPFGYPLSSVDGTITCHCDDDQLGASKTNPKTFRLPRDTESAWKVLNGAMDYNICNQQYSSEICNYIRSCGSCYADIKRCYLNGIGVPNCFEKNDVMVMDNANGSERNKIVKFFIPRPDEQDTIKKRSVPEEIDMTSQFKASHYIDVGKSCRIPYFVLNGELHCYIRREMSECEIRCKPGFELPEGASRKIICDETAGNNVWRPGGSERCIETYSSVSGKPDARKRKGSRKILIHLTKPSDIHSSVRGKPDARELKEATKMLNLLTN